MTYEKRHKSLNEDGEGWILKAFNDKPEYEKRTLDGLAEQLEFDRLAISDILEYSNKFEACIGCKGDMWRVSSRVITMKPNPNIKMILRSK